MDGMQTLGEHCSMTERRADDATRDAIDWLKCEHMLDRVGETYSGIITSTTSFGLFVELQDIYVEGLVHVTALGNDYYHFDPTRHWLIGERTNRIFRLGDQLEVKVVRVNLDERKIDFELSEKSATRSGKAGRKAKSKSKSRSKSGPKSSSASKKKSRTKYKTKRKSTSKAQPKKKRKTALRRKSR